MRFLVSSHATFTLFLYTLSLGLCVLIHLGVYTRGYSYRKGSSYTPDDGSCAAIWNCDEMMFSFVEDQFSQTVAYLFLGHSITQLRQADDAYNYFSSFENLTHCHVIDTTQTKRLSIDVSKNSYFWNFWTPNHTKLHLCFFAVFCCRHIP